MSFTKKIAVAVNLNDPNLEILKSIRSMDFINDSEVYFVHAYLTTTYAIGLGEGALIYPIEEDRKKIQDYAYIKLREMSKELMPINFKGKVHIECIFSDDPKRKFCQYLDHNKIDTVIVAAREKKGFFESSFTQYLNKHTHANMIILKHREK